MCCATDTISIISPNSCTTLTHSRLMSSVVDQRDAGLCCHIDIATQGHENRGRLTWPSKMPTSNADSSSCLHFKISPIGDFRVRILGGELPVHRAQLLTFEDMPFSALGFEFPGLLGIFSHPHSKLFVDARGVRGCGVRCQAGCMFLRDELGWIKLFGDPGCDSSGNRMIDILGDEVEEDTEDEELGTGNQCNKAVEVGEDGVVPAMPAVAKWPDGDDS